MSPQRMYGVRIEQIYSPNSFGKPIFYYLSIVAIIYNVYTSFAGHSNKFLFFIIPAYFLFTKNDMRSSFFSFPHFLYWQVCKTMNTALGYYMINFKVQISSDLNLQYINIQLILDEPTWRWSVHLDCYIRFCTSDVIVCLSIKRNKINRFQLSMQLSVIF